MNKILIVLSLCIFFLSGQVNAQMKDDGYSGDTHKRYNAKTVFSSSEIVYQEENEALFQTEFTYGDPLYARIYWYPGLNNIYDLYGWSSAKGYYYFKEIYINDDLIVSNFEICDKGGCTTMPLCLNLADGDSKKWIDSDFLDRNYYLMKVGNNTVTIKIYPYNVFTKDKGELLSIGSFNVKMEKEDIISAGNYYFKEMKTYFSSGDDIWNEWKMSVNNKNGRLFTTKKSDKNNWEYIIGYCTGEISTLNTGDFSSFELKSGEKVVQMKYGESNSWNTWTISDAHHSIDLGASIQDGSENWNEWMVQSEFGSLKMKTSYTIGDNLWKEWEIRDELHVSTELKMAAIFLVIFNSAAR